MPPFSSLSGVMRQRSAMLQGLNLAEGSDLVKRWGIDPGNPLRDFVQASERTDKWRRARALVAATILLCAFAGLAAVATLQWGRADRAAQAPDRTNR